MVVHQQTQQPKVGTTKQKLPPVERTKLNQDVTEEEWESFYQDWKRFSRCTDIPAGQQADQLFNCCEKGLAKMTNTWFESTAQDELLSATDDS